MGKGVGVPFVADVSDFLKGTKQVEGALDDVIDSLDGVAREGKSSADLVGRAFEGMEDDVAAAEARLDAKFDAFFREFGDDADAASNVMEREFKTAFDSVERNAKTSSAKTKKVLDDVPDGIKKSSKGRFADIGSDIGGELSQNIGEGISSGKVGIAGAVDTVLGTLGGVLPALGPVGAVVGVGALVVGSIVKGITDNQAEVVKAVNQAVSDAVDAAADAFDNGKKTRTLGEIVSGFTPEEKKNLHDSGIEIYDAATAIKTYEDTGDPAKIDAITKKIDDRANAVKGLGTTSGDLFSGPAPSIFDVGGPLLSDPAASAAIDRQTDSIKARAAALRDMERAAANVDLSKLKAVRAELNKPINQSDSSLRRYLTP